LNKLQGGIFIKSNILKEVILKNGDLLVLRRPAEDDAKAMIDYLNQVGGESDNLLFGKNEFNLTVEQEMQFINKINNDENTLMLISLINNSIVSIAQISCYQRKRISHNCEIAISVMKQYWQVGIGSAVMDELIQFAKNHKNIRNIGLGVKASNERAIRLYEKFDFVKVGYHKDYFKINDEYDDLILMDLYLDK
jgi:RimJ/RimL family protein N-acetyltransferase